MPEGASIIIDRLTLLESLRPHRPTFDSQISPHAQYAHRSAICFFVFGPFEQALLALLRLLLLHTSCTVAFHLGWAK